MTDFASADVRQLWEGKTAGLVGRRILNVSYWDIYGFGEPRTWNYGDCHHAVMGIELETDTGPVSIVWTNTFFPYGLEVFHEPMSTHLDLHEEGPEGWSVTDDPEWVARTSGPIERAEAIWNPVHFAPGPDGSPARHVEVPVGLQLDFAAGPLWVVCGTPQWPNIDDVFIMGDELMVVWSADRMRRIGFPDSFHAD